MAGLVEIRGLTKRHMRRGLLQRAARGAPAVDRVSFTVERGTVFGLVGESGCGKTTLARALLHLDPPTSGEIMFDGESLAGLSRRGLRDMRRRMQIVFQDPNAALDPKMRVRQSMEEGLRNMGIAKTERERRVRELLELVGIPADHASRWPHEFSGGQKQRIVIARALTMDPEFLVLDEPVSNLDVSIQAQIVNLLQVLRERFNLTYLFISHDLHLVAYLADRIGVMFRGRLVECADTAELMARPLHPYTRKLFSSAPGTTAVADAPDEPIEEQVPDLRDVGGGHLVALADPTAAPDGSLGPGGSPPAGLPSALPGPSSAGGPLYTESTGMQSVPVENRDKGGNR